MAKKILAIFFVSILLCSYIIPTTSAFADVVIGDNDSYAVTELGVENGKKIATMEAILQLLESGVSEINFNNISDLDDYLEDFYDELTNVNYQDVSNEILAGAYNDVKELKQWIDDRGEYIATYYKDYLNSADEGLSDIFNDFQLKLPKSKLVGTSLNGFRSLSRFNGDSSNPNPNPDFNFIENINTCFLDAGQIVLNLNDFTRCKSGFNDFYDFVNNPSSCTIYGSNLSSAHNNNGVEDIYVSFLSPILTINVDTSDSNNIIARYSSYVRAQIAPTNVTGAYYLKFTASNNGYPVSWVTTDQYQTPQYTFDGLSSCINYIYSHFANINLYVDGEPWVIYDSSRTPTINIDGYVKLYGNDNPIQYEFPQGTQIDYNALYNTIYNAIRDNLPLDMQTINNNQVYYDSHDTVYSPTIYNYYGKDGDDENDWIDSILDYATIPDFNSALGTVAVLDTPFVNGITIVNAGVTDVIPSDILLIFGGFFVLVLFVCIINRMSE